MTLGTGNKRAFDEGFTLIEVLVAAVILSAGLAAILGAYAQAVTALNAATDELVTTRILNEKVASLELVAGGDWRSLPPGGGACPPPFSDYEWSVTHRLLNAESGLEGAEVVVEVWRARQRDRRSLVTQWAVLPVQKAQPGGPTP